MGAKDMTDYEQQRLRAKRKLHDLPLGEDFDWPIGTPASWAYDLSREVAGVKGGGSFRTKRHPSGSGFVTRRIK